MSDVTRILNAIERGDVKATDELLPLVYEELRLLAAQKLSKEPPGQTLQATALVHEAYLRLLGDEGQTWQSKGHFFAAAAEAMRRILVENARRKQRLKRGGDHQRVDLDDVGLTVSGPCDDLVALYEALDKLAQKDKVKADLVKLRFFAGLTTEQVISRFEAERQALALMDHPNIAQVFDGGSTETGRPYFVMELVRGVSITDYCDKNRQSTRERLELFGQVCNAVQHAHQKGIIHRDIKPSNVMVTLHDGKPVPKVIDFGIAKAINQWHHEIWITDRGLNSAIEGDIL